MIKQLFHYKRKQEIQEYEYVTICKESRSIPFIAAVMKVLQSIIVIVIDYFTSYVNKYRLETHNMSVLTV
jgi:hypothetical protein